MADNVEIQGLEFQIVNDSTQAVAGLQNLINTLNRLKTATNGGATGLSKTAQGIRELSNSLKGLNSGDASQKITRLANALTALSRVGNVKISSSIANQLTAINTAIAGLKWTDGDKLTSLANGLRPLSELGKANMTTFINQLSKLPKVIEDLKTADIDKFTQQMTALAAAMKPFADEMQQVSNGFSAFPSKIQKLITSTEKYNASISKATPTTGKFTSGLKALNVATAAVAFRKISHFIAQAVTESNKYQEDLNLFTVALGQYADEAKEYAEKVSDVMGIDPAQWLRNQGIFNTLLTGFGDTAERAQLMSKNLTQLGYDLSSYANIPIEDAMQKLQSGIAGELEPLRRLGYDLSQARLQQELLNLGYSQSVSTLSQADKAVLRYIAIMKQTTDAQGDFARTINSPANQIKILKAQLNSLARSVGSLLYPALKSILPPLIAAVELIKELVTGIATLMGVKVEFPDFSNASDAVSGVTDAMDDTTKATGKAAKAFKNYIMGFDELNVIQKDNGSSGGSGSGAGAAGNLLGDVDLSGYDMFKRYNEELAKQIDSIKEKMKGGASSASEFAEVITNTYGWIVMKPAAIDKELWDNIYNVYVKDELNLGVKQYFEQQNPAALEEMTAVMLESARKGLWQASEEQVAELSKLHTEIVNTYRPSCSGFVCDNAKLRDFIASKADAQTATQYKENISKIREAKASGSNKGVVMKKEEMNQTAENQTNTLSNVAVGIAVIIVILALILFVRKRRKSSQM